MTQFHYKGGVEELSDEQSQLDAAVLGAFGMLETQCAMGVDVGKNAIYAGAIAAATGSLDRLPPERAKHWRAELGRIGVAAPAPAKKEEEKAKDSKGAGRAG